MTERTAARLRRLIEARRCRLDAIHPLSEWDAWEREFRRLVRLQAWLSRGHR